MESTKRLLLALGLVLSILGVCNKTWAMEQKCKLSTEIIELHKVVSQEIQSLPTLAQLRLNNSPVINTNFLEMKPFEILYILQYAMDWLQIQIAENQKPRNLGQTPGTMDHNSMESYEANSSLLHKIKKLFDLIKNTCGIKDKQINIIKNQLHNEWTKEFESRGWGRYEK